MLGVCGTPVTQCPRRRLEKIESLALWDPLSRRMQNWHSEQRIIAMLPRGCICRASILSLTPAHSTLHGNPDRPRCLTSHLWCLVITNLIWDLAPERPVQILPLQQFTSCVASINLSELSFLVCKSGIMLGLAIGFCLQLNETVWKGLSTASDTSGLRDSVMILTFTCLECVTNSSCELPAAQEGLRLRLGK